MRDVETRTIPGVVEFRDAADGGSVGQLAGYALRYNKLSQNLGGFVERILPGTFTKSLADNVRVVARFQHKDEYVLGTSDAGTLALRDDGQGIHYVIDMPNTSTGRDVAVLAKRGDVRFSSFAFRTAENGDSWSETDSGYPLRSVSAGQLLDVAPVVTPAYLDSSTAMRSLADRIHVEPDELRHMETKEIVARLAGEDLSTEEEREGEAPPFNPLADPTFLRFRLELMNRA